MNVTLICNALDCFEIIVNYFECSCCQVLLTPLLHYMSLLHCHLCCCCAFSPFCRRLQPATILTRFIAALTRLRELFLYAYPCTMMTTSSDLETVDVSWISWVNCSFRMKAISPKLGSDTWHNIIYTSQNNYKSSSTTQNWRKLQNVTILSCWRHFCMLRLSKNSYLHHSAHDFWHFWWFRTRILENDRLVETMTSIHTIIIGVFKNIC